MVRVGVMVGVGGMGVTETTFELMVSIQPHDPQTIIILGVIGQAGVGILVAGSARA